MNFLETMGEMELQRAEGNRQIAAVLVDGFRRLGQSIARLAATALSHEPRQHSRL